MTAVFIYIVGKNKGPGKLSVSGERRSAAHGENVEVFRVCMEADQWQQPTSLYCHDVL